MFPIDFKDAHFQISIPPNSLPYLGNTLDGRVYQFKALCFGVSTVPQAFIRVFSLVSDWVHKRGIHLPCYLDDWLVIEKLGPLLLKQQEHVPFLCKDLGSFSWEKSHL